MKKFTIAIFVFFLIYSASAAEYDRILGEMNQLIDANSNFVQMIDIGKNDQGNTIYGMRIENPTYQADGGKIYHLLVGVHHGNERTSADLCMTFSKNLLKIIQNSKDQYYKALSRDVFFVIPVLNIGGFNANRRGEYDKHNSYVDPNRDYPDACVHNEYYQLASIQNLANFVEKNNIIGSVTVHGYIGTFTYPWGIYTDNTHTADHDFFKSIAGKAIKANNYRTGTHTDVIYPAVGAYEDWAYHKYGIWTMLLELSYSADLERDSRAVITFFAMLPSERSHQHEHTGNCTKRGDDGQSRP